MRKERGEGERDRHGGRTAARRCRGWLSGNHGEGKHGLTQDRDRERL